MTVRRLAEIQPDSFDFTPENRAWVDRQIRKYPDGRQASAVMALLRRAQQQNDGWVSKPAIERIAEILGMPYIRVLEVATFYTMYNLKPVGRYFIQFCGTTPCVLRGANDIKAVLERRVGPMDGISADGNFSWLEVECLGACCNAPMVQINETYYEDLTAENFDKLLDDLEAGRPVERGSQIGRRTSEPIGGLTSLTSLYGVNGHEGLDSGIHEPSVNGVSGPHSGHTVDERTTGPDATYDDKMKRTERSEHALATPDPIELGTRRTHPAVSEGAHETEKATQAATKGEPADAPSIPMGHEPKGGQPGGQAPEGPPPNNRT